MKKNSLKTLLLAGVLAIATVIAGVPAEPVLANTVNGSSDWAVTFTEKSKMESNFKTGDFDEVIGHYTKPLDTHRFFNTIGKTFPSFEFL